MFYVTYQRVKFFRIFLVIGSGAMGFISGLLYGKINNYFHKNCLLYANVSIDMNKDMETNKEELNVYVQSKTVWGHENMCELVTFEGFLVFMTSFIWLWFFLNMDFTSDSPLDRANPLPLSSLSFQRQSLSSHYQHLRNRPILEARNALFVLPPIICNTILCFVSVVRVAYASDGYEQFCYRLCKSKNHATCDAIFTACDELQSHNWVFLSSQESSLPFAFHDAMKAALVMSWLEPLFMATHVLVILGHVYLEANPTDHSTSAISATDILTKKSRAYSPSCTPPSSRVGHEDLSKGNSELDSLSARSAGSPSRHSPLTPRTSLKVQIVDNHLDPVGERSHSVDEQIKQFNRPTGGRKSEGNARTRVSIISTLRGLKSSNSGEDDAVPMSRKRQFSQSEARKRESIQSQSHKRASIQSQSRKRQSTQSETRKRQSTQSETRKGGISPSESIKGVE